MRTVGVREGGSRVAVHRLPSQLGTDMSDLSCKVLIIGGGPGGYVAAIRAGELGLDTVLIEDGPVRRNLPPCRLHPVQGADPRCGGRSMR